MPVGIRGECLGFQVSRGWQAGLGNQLGRKGYMTPYEELWLASLRLLISDATLDQAREIYRAASGRRKG